MKHFRQTSHQPPQIFAALILTGILSLGAGITFANATTANSLESPQGVAGLNQGEHANLPQSVIDAVLKVASQQTGLPKDRLSIVQFQQIQGSSSCLGIPPHASEMCTADLVPLWQVTVAGRTRLIYHTSLDGSQIKLNTNLPQSVADAVFNAASQRTGLPKNELSILQFQQIQGSSSCLGIPPSLGEMCTADLVPLWQVTVAGGQYRLVYHASWDGSQIKQNQTASWKIKTLAASSLLMIVPLLGLHAYRRRIS